MDLGGDIRSSTHARHIPWLPNLNFAEILILVKIVALWRLPSLPIPHFLPASSWRLRMPGPDVRDGSLLLGALLAFNFLCAPHDPGWLSLNPSPWLLVPAFLGARYGLRTGLAGALAPAALLLIWQSFASPASGQEPLIQQHPFFLSALLGMAAIAGTAQRMVAARTEQTGFERESLIHELEAVRHTARLLRLDRESLQDLLRKHHAPFASLPGDLARLTAAGPEDWGALLLELLAKRFGVREAAIYRQTPDGSLRLATCTGEEAVFASMLAPEQASPVVKAALRSSQMVTCRHLWEEASGYPDEMLAAFPAQSSPAASASPASVTALLLIRRMDFDAIHWENLARIEALWRWVLCVAAGDGQRDEPEAARFQRKLRLAATLDELVSLPFHLIRFDGSGFSPETWEEFGSFLCGRLRNTDALSLSPARDGKPAYAQVLVPATDRASPESLVETWLEPWPHGKISWTTQPLRK